ncbi:VanZ family protein [Ectothiorhodospira variabilis]|uniref:VanZ family protein n=1 Tax=Ectothiorhodospira variabilis TaxID=505694 RepID=UPI001EFBDE8E|nr:VanZ family protein [Ectothiorhodospira variabilis]MCG5497522.1 VanZ family protein [Ectothiorhodospira variabilis]
MALAAWVSLLAVLYATLMPFEFGNQSVAQAWAHFTSLEFPRMSASGRQQWVANVLMFVPLGLFWTAWLSGYVRGVGGRVVVGMFVALLALATTASVEFLQFWLPLREPSLLDMSGNFVGGVVGVLAWYGLSGPGRRWLVIVRQGGLAALWWALVMYMAVYMLTAWLPWDFMVSLQEVSAKLESDRWGLWQAPVSEGAGGEWWVLRSMIVVMTAPVGVVFGWWLSRAVPALGGVGTFAVVMFLALAFGLLVELGQFLTVSGVAEGGSLLSRALGVAFGAVLFVKRSHFSPDRVRHWARPMVLLLLVPFLVLMGVLNLGGEGFALETGSVSAKLDSVRFLPFWYHYTVPEAVAIGSVIVHVLMYLPVGIGIWLWRWGPLGATPRRGVLAAVMLALLLALLMELGKLFMTGLRPDPTSLWIAVGAAWLGWQVCALVWRGLRGARDWRSAGDEHPSRLSDQEGRHRQAPVEGIPEYPGIEPADSGFVRGESEAGRAPQRVG